MNQKVNGMSIAIEGLRHVYLVMSITLLPFSRVEKREKMLGD